ncbi:MAG: hypothetical protein KW804_02710 [Candidatus Doudnabacteria bacterium]|nr:hypothetical protein [Candidatus Doudnabacteria bacterium]
MKKDLGKASFGLGLVALVIFAIEYFVIYPLLRSKGSSPSVVSYSVFGVYSVYYFAFAAMVISFLGGCASVMKKQDKYNTKLFGIIAILLAFGSVFLLLRMICLPWGC